MFLKGCVILHKETNKLDYPQLSLLFNNAIKASTPSGTENNRISTWDTSTAIQKISQLQPLPTRDQISCAGWNLH